MFQTNKVIPDKRWNKLVKPRGWLTKLENEVPDLLRRGDSVNVWGVPSMGTSSQLRKLTESSNGEIIYVYVDTQWLSSISAESFYDLLNSQLSEAAETEMDANGSTSSLMETQRLISAITKEKELCMIFDTIEELSGLGETFFSSVKALRDRFFGRLCFIFVSNRPIYDHPEFENKENFIDFACHREVISTPFSDRYTEEALPELFEYFRVQPEKSQEARIVELSGGILGLLKNILRFHEMNPGVEITEEALLEEQSINNRLKRICEILTEDEAEYLHTLAMGKPPQTKASKFISKSGLIEKGVIRSSLLKHAIVEGCRTAKKKTNGALVVEDTTDTPRGKGITIDIISGEIYKNGKRLPEVLSKTETRIVQTMLEHPGTLITRDEVAHEIWGQETKEKYSEWAIDKAISRIRKKIGDTERPNKHLITIKGKGFKFYPKP